MTATAASQLDTTGVGLTREVIPPLEQAPLDPRTWFENGSSAVERYPRPLDIEIGSGKGTFLVQQAAVTPGVDYLGIEYAKEYWRHAADRGRRHGLTNVRVLHADANEFIQHWVADRVCRQVHIYFPDPWPKARHHKRRLIQAPFLRHLHRILQDPAPVVADSAVGSALSCDAVLPQRGIVRLATDHADYFAWMEERVDQVAELFQRRPFESTASAEEGELVGTNFERKYRREGRRFYGMVLVKRVTGESAG